MRQRTSSVADVMNSTSHKQRRTSYQESYKNIDFNGKLQKYRILLEKEYELRSRLQKSCSTEDRRRCVSFCDCGRQILPTQVSFSCHGNGNMSAFRKVPPPTYRGTDQVRSRLIHRPLSADYVQTPTAAALRKLISDEKADKRRASIKSLEEDFEKVRLFIQRRRTLSESSFDENKDHLATSFPDSFTDDTQNEYISMRSQVIASLKEKPSSSIA